MVPLFIFVVAATSVAATGQGQNHRVMDGYIAGPNQFTFVIGISIYKDTGYANWCTGSIINEKWILTAGHCVENMNSDTKLAIYGRDGYEKDPDYRPVLQFFLHPKYNHIEMYDDDFVDNDIALLELEHELDLTNGTFSKAILPRQGESKPPASTPAEIAGFGRTRDASEPKYLYAGDVLVRNCAFYYFESTICVRYFTANICKGDSGGPLILNEREVVGVASTSTSPYCDTSSLTARSAYAQVSLHIDWIEETTGLKFD